MPRPATLALAFLALLSGCKGATAPEPNPYSGFAGTWVGATATHQLRIEVREGTMPFGAGPGQPASVLTLDHAVSFSDIANGYSGNTTGSFAPVLASLSDLEPGEASFSLLTVEVIDSTGTRSPFGSDLTVVGSSSERLFYSFRGKLRGSHEMVGDVVVSRTEPPNWWPPVSVVLFPMTLRRQ